METGKKSLFRGCWRVLYPLLLYMLLSELTAFCVGGPLGLSMLEKTLLSEIVCAAALWKMYRADKRRAGQDTWKPVMPELYPLVWVVSGAAALAFLSSQLLYLTGITEWSARFQEINDALTLESVWMQLLTAVVAAPLMEELLMRGVVYGRLKNMVSAQKAIVCSALLFGILHGNLAQGIHAFVVGLFLAWVMERFDNILVPVLCHMAANLSAFVAFPGVSGTEYVLTLVVCAACAGRSIQIINQIEN